MNIKLSILLVTALNSSVVLADLSKPYKLTVGDRLASCVERTVPLMDRTVVGNIRSYTKYDKHYVSLNSVSIYIDYSVTNNSLNAIYVNNTHIETVTSAEEAKVVLQGINSSLIQPSLGYCSKMLGLEEKVELSMLFIDPPYESRPLKRVIKMGTSGQFTLP